MSYILFDIGGTKTRIALSHDLKTYETPVKFDTVPEFEAGIEAFTDAVHDLAGDCTIDGIAGGIRGVLDHDKHMLISDPGGPLSLWTNKPIADMLNAQFAAPVYLENDAAIAALGEAHFGAGKGYEIVAYHTVSTGVGGARVDHGEIDHSSVGFEPGHQVLEIDDSILPPDVPHTLENLVSGTALEKRRKVKPYEIPQDDPIWDELAGYLAHGLKNTVVYWSPDIIVLGGSMIVGDPRILNDAIASHTEALLKPEKIPCPPIVDAAFRDDGGLYGAMGLLKQRGI